MKTFGIPLIAGRDFDERDGFDKPPVVLISKSTAQKLFPGEEAVGKRMYFGTDNGTGLVTEIVGVVGDIRSRVWIARTMSNSIGPGPSGRLLFCTSPCAAAQTGKRGRHGARRLEPDRSRPADHPAATMEAIVSQSLGQQRLTMTLLGAFAGVALLLAAVGIYGAVAYTVEQRTGEIGVRMALGAQTMDVLRLVVKQGMSPVFIGLGLGIAAALVMGRLLTTQLYQVSAHNPALLAGTAVMLATVALLACLMPARRATLVNPIEALRTE